jgi:hypothetical protein
MNQSFLLTLKRARPVLALIVLFACAAAYAPAQTSIATGSIQGTITDPTGAVVPNAKVTITNLDTNQMRETATSSSGNFSSGALLPGNYSVKVEGQGFSPVETRATVQISTTTAANMRLSLRGNAEVIEVRGGTTQVNTEQATVQGVLNAEQIDTLPINGRNFLDLAQLEPGVQVQDGANFDPTKGGFSGISVGGRQGRTTRIEVDGLDVTDENVGTTLSNYSASSIEEFSIQQSTLDLASELTSSGAVNVATRTGTNAWHGDGFYLFRDKALAANFTGGQDSPYQRNQYGGRFGGPILKDKLFFFMNAERVKQALGVPVSFDAPFNGLTGAVNEPFKERLLFGRLDWQVRQSARAFYRINYDQLAVTTNGLPDFSVFKNVNKTPAQAAGIDFNTGSWNHSIRYGYTKFVNGITDGVAGTGTYEPVPGAQLRIGALRAGPNPNAPQATLQSNNQVKYDGSKPWKSHLFRYGFGYNRITAGGFANFYGLGPRLRSSTSAADQAAAAAGPFPGGASNPLNYPLHRITMGNGQGFNSDISTFGLPAGGFLDNRVQWFVGDTWKMRSNFTFSAGLRYLRDTGRTMSDIAPIPCSALVASHFDPVPTCPASGHLLDLFGPGFGNRVRQDNNNFAPQIGIAWDPGKNGKTVIRAGAGMFYENQIFNNVLFSRPGYLQKGLFNHVADDNNTGEGCQSGIVNFPSGPVSTIPSTGVSIKSLCGQAIGSVADQVIALSNDYQAATRAAGAAANPNFVGNTLVGPGLLFPDYRTPFSYQMNLGIQREIRPGMVFSADYLRNINLHSLVAIDSNQVGNTRYFNKNAALNAINLTNESFGCADGVAGIDCAIAAGAGMGDYAGNGLADSTHAFGGPANAIPPGGTVGRDPDHGAAFPGINPLVGSNIAFAPAGRSVYNALQLSLRDNMTYPLPFMRSLSLQISYSLSRYLDGIGGDQDFITGVAVDNVNPNRYLGPASFDRTHQLGFGVTFQTVKGPMVSMIGHFNSPLPSNMFAPSQSRPDEIFHTDLNGDGTTADPITKRVGAYGRDVKPDGLVQFLHNFNSTVAGNVTPAGQVLVDQGLFSKSQLASLGGVIDSIDTSLFDAGGKPVNNGWLKVFDLKLAYPIKIKDRFTIEPSAAVYNLFNFSNFDTNPFTILGSAAGIAGILDGSPGSVNGTIKGDPRNSERAFQSSSSFGLGSPRQFEFGLRIVF